MAKYCIRYEDVVHLLRHRETLIGRSSSCPISVNQSKVSRVHAMLRRSSEGVELVDLGSMNGTLVNGQRLRRPRLLSDGDVLRVGDLDLRFCVEADDHYAEDTTVSSLESRAPIEPGLTMDAAEILVAQAEQDPTSLSSARALLEGLLSRLEQSASGLTPAQLSRLQQLLPRAVADLSAAPASAQRERLQRRAEALAARPPTGLD